MNKITNKCLRCGNPISKGHKHCKPCYYHIRFNKPAIYKNKEWLKKQYFDNRLSFASIAELAGCGTTTIAKWFKRFNLKPRPAPCYGKALKELSPNWKGGRQKLNSGYIRIHHSDSRAKGYYTYEHVVVMEKKLGRKLAKGEVVHHINGIRDDNRPENLQLFRSYKAHQDYEHLLKSFAKQILFGKLAPNLKPQLLEIFNTYLVSRNE